MKAVIISIIVTFFIILMYNIHDNSYDRSNELDERIYSIFGRGCHYSIPVGWNTSTLSNGLTGLVPVNNTSDLVYIFPYVPSDVKTISFLENEFMIRNLILENLDIWNKSSNGMVSGEYNILNSTFFTVNNRTSYILDYNFSIGNDTLRRTDILIEFRTKVFEVKKVESMKNHNNYDDDLYHIVNSVEC